MNSDMGARAFSYLWQWIGRHPNVCPSERIQLILWQSQWTGLNIDTIKPQVGNWATANTHSWLEERISAKLRKKCTRIDRRFPTHCDICYVALSISHTILNCLRFMGERAFLTTSTLKWRGWWCDFLEEDRPDQSDVTLYCYYCNCFIYLRFILWIWYDWFVYIVF